MAHIQQILCSDPNDSKITSDLNYSLFRTDWSDFTPFIKSTTILPIKNNYQFGSVTDIILEQNGDFLQQLTLMCDLPVVQSSYKTIKLIEVIRFLSEYDIILTKEELSNLDLNENLKNNTSAYDNLMSIIKNRLIMFQNVIHLLKRILESNFSSQIVEELINREDNYLLYVTLKNYVKDPTNYHTVVDTDWVINYVKNKLIEKIITQHDYTADFKLLLEMNTNDTLSNNLEILINKSKDTILFKYLYAVRETDYNKFFDYLANEIITQRSTLEHVSTGALLYYHENTFVAPNNLILTPVQNDILNQINILLKDVLKLYDVEKLKSKLDVIAASDDYLNLKNHKLRIVLCNLNMLPIIVLEDLKEYLMCYCTENCYEIKILISSCLDEIKHKLLEKIKVMSKVLLKSDYQNILDEKINILLNENIILPEDLGELFGEHLYEIECNSSDNYDSKSSNSDNMANVFKIAQEYLQALPLNLLLYQIKILAKNYCNTIDINSPTNPFLQNTNSEDNTDDHSTIIPISMGECTESCSNNITTDELCSKITVTDSGTNDDDTKDQSIFIDDSSHITSLSSAAHFPNPSSISSSTLQSFNTIINDELPKTNEQIIMELRTIQKLITRGFNNITYADSDALHLLTYEQLVNASLNSIVSSNVITDMIGLDTINKIKNKLLLDSYVTTNEFLRGLNESTNSQMLTLKQITYPLFSIDFSELLKKHLLEDMQLGNIYKYCKKRDHCALKKEIKYYKKLIKNITEGKSCLIKILNNLHKGKCKKLEYIPNVGIKMIEKVDFYVDDILITSDYGERIYAEHLLEDNIRNRVNYERLTSHGYGQLMVPLRFWFNKNIERALPVCNMTQKTLMLRVTLKNVRDLVIYKLQPDVRFYDICESQSFSGSLLAQYYFLNPCDRESVRKSITYNVVELIQKSGPDNLNECDMDQNRCISLQYYLRRMIKTLLIVVNKADIVNGIEISYDGIVREVMKPISYYNLLQPYERYMSDFTDSDKSYFVYTFSLNPLSIQPSGNMDASDIKNVTVKYRLKSSLRNTCATVTLYSSYYELLKFCHCAQDV